MQLTLKRKRLYIYLGYFYLIVTFLLVVHPIVEPNSKIDSSDLYVLSNFFTQFGILFWIIFSILMAPLWKMVNVRSLVNYFCFVVLSLIWIVAHDDLSMAGIFILFIGLVTFVFVVLDLDKLREQISSNIIP